METKEVKKPRTKKPVSLPTQQVTRVRTNQIASGFGMMKSITISLIVFSTLVVVGSLFAIMQINKNANSRAYFITESGTAMGTSDFNYNEARQYEIENHINLFAKNMFEFDQGNFDSNIERALHLIGDDGKIIYKGYLDGNMKNTLIKNNAKISVVVDSIKVVSNKEPYKYKMYARQSFRTSLGLRQQFLWVDLSLIDVSRSRNNYHGLLIESFDIKNNKLVPKSLIRQELESR